MHKVVAGQRIKTGSDEWEVVWSAPDLITVVVISTGPDQNGSIGSYLDIGKTYRLVPIHQDEFEEWWEIPASQMKRCTSQVILYLDTKGGETRCTIDLCS